MEGEQENEDDFSVFIGHKDTKTYVFSVVDQTQTHDKVLIKARGRVISKAVDTALISIEKYIKEVWEVKNIKIETEIRPYRQEGELLAEPQKDDQEVSIIEIEIGKK